jgi:hypothetical protein
MRNTGAEAVMPVAACKFLRTPFFPSRNLKEVPDHIAGPDVPNKLTTCPRSEQEAAQGLMLQVFLDCQNQFLVDRADRRISTPSPIIKVPQTPK